MASSLSLSAQKKVLDHDVYDSWQSVAGTALTSDGKFLSYTVSPQEGDGELIITNLTTSKELKIARGTSVKLSADGKWAVCTIKPTLQQTKDAKKPSKGGDSAKEDKTPKDTLAYINLNTFEVKKVVGAEGPKMARDSFGKVVYKSTDKKDSKVVVLDLATGKVDTLKHVDKYAVTTAGDKLVVVTKKDKSDSLSKDGIMLYKLATMECVNLTEGLGEKKSYTLPSFNEKGDMAYFMASTDSAKTGSKLQGLYLYKETPATKKQKASWSVSEILPQGYSNGIPAGWALTEEGSASFSNASNRVLVTLKKIRAPKDTTLVASEIAQLDIWSYDQLTLPPQAKIRKPSLSLQGVIDLANPGKLVLLTNRGTERLSIPNGGNADFGVVTDNSKYAINSSWDAYSYNDIYFVNVKDGSRKTFAEKFDGRVSLSTNGKYFIWFSDEDKQFHTYNIATGVEAEVSSKAGVVFFDEDVDTPSRPGSYSSPQWLENDEAFLVSDRYDIWKITPDGKKVENLTKGVGRKNNVQFRITKIVEDPTVTLDKGIEKKSRIFLTAFQEKDKRNGFGSVSVAAPEEPKFFLDTFKFAGAVKAKDANVIAFRKGNVRLPNNQYVTFDEFKTDKQLSDINKQQKDYVWPNVQLVEWKAYDGTPLQGLLYTPDNLDKSKKYPMMIYFYEKYSETLYSPLTPAPSRSTVNLAFYASRGYVVFVPDIVYTTGHPGESAYNCICAGAEAMCDQFSFIDKSKMAIQGQSWGGYQTAYLITRTNMFAAAGSGAPVGNMTSAYGGIRWESGNSRAGQYEHGQSRIGKSLWDEGGLELYIENSPVFHANKVNTPVLIMSNDADGAVPWYQGIEYFMALRHFNKPAWLLEYNDEAHNLVQRKNTKDLSRRLQQFFDHYLKGAPMPAWMKNGVPTELKSEYFGFEYAE